ncbi:MAG: sugar transferase [Cyclobacteriaceae bacterium]
MKAGFKKKYPSAVKPFFDKTGAFVLIVLCLPIFLFFSFLLLLVNRGDVFFHQQRAGKNGKIFSILKFRTMRDNHEISKVGILLRKLSLDELPQLVNVLRGEMSLVGPRPLLVEYLEYYNKEEQRRHTVRPGITGLAQVNGRNRSDWKTRMANDLYYVDNISFFLDCRILAMTALQLLKFKQADSADQNHGTFIDYASKR